MIRFLTLIMIMTVLPDRAWAQNDLALCKLRAQYIASPDVAFQPGVDVHGNPVVPADVNAYPAMIPDVIRIPVSIDLAERLGHVPEGAELKTETGMVEVHRDGRVTFNGQDFTQQTNIVCDDNAAATQVIAPETDLPPQTLGQIPVETVLPPAGVQQPQPVDTQTTIVDQQKDIIWGQGY